MIFGLFLLAFNQQSVSAMPEPFTPFRMGDWAQCRDGTQVYERNPQYPLEGPSEDGCQDRGGTRAHAPGKRLNDKD